MAKINYIVGDATKPEKPTIIAQGNNSCGCWGAGFVVAIDKLSIVPRQEYRKWFKVTEFYCNNDGCVADDEGKYGIPFMLGEIQLVKLSSKLYVANMITQKDVGNFHHLIPFRVDSTRECFFRLALAAKKLKINHVTMPRIGCGLAGARWEQVEPLVLEELVANDVDVDVYDLPPTGQFASRVEFGKTFDKRNKMVPTEVDYSDLPLDLQRMIKEREELDND